MFILKTLVQIAILIFVPFFAGKTVCLIFRNRESGTLATYIAGILSLLLLFLGIVLVGLKTDIDYVKFSKVAVYAPLVPAFLGMAVWIIQMVKQSHVMRKPVRPSFDKNYLWFAITGLFLAGLSYFCYEPSYLNDDTWEFVKTTVSTGTWYKYSVLNGREFIAGLPIFNKIYIMPLVYSVLESRLRLNMELMGGILVPLFLYSAHLSLIYSLSGRIFDKEDGHKRASFMCAYLIILMAGTYLPLRGVPVTAGYALLREGYSGYAFVYGVLLPYVVLHLYDKKYLQAVCFMLPALGLVRIDRILLNIIKAPISSWTDINTAGKLMVFYIVAVFVNILLLTRCRKTVRGWMYLMPSFTIAITIVEIGDVISNNRKRMAYFASVGLLLFFACNLRPFNDAETKWVSSRRNTAVAQCLRDVEGDVTLWSTDEVMAIARRVDSNTKLLYTRAAYTPYMVGLDYEPVSDNLSEYLTFMKNKDNVYDYLVSEKTGEEVIACAVNEGANCIILRQITLSEDTVSTLLRGGFSRISDHEGYVVFKYMATASK